MVILYTMACYLIQKFLSLSPNSGKSHPWVWAFSCIPAAMMTSTIRWNRECNILCTTGTLIKVWNMLWQKSQTGLFGFTNHSSLYGALSIKLSERSITQNLFNYCNNHVFILFTNYICSWYYMKIWRKF